MKFNQPDEGFVSQFGRCIDFNQGLLPGGSFPLLTQLIAHIEVVIFLDMLNSKPASYTDRRSGKGISQNPSLSQLLFADCGSSANRIAAFIDPVLDAPNRCEISPYYIQAVAMGQTAFLSTNLPDVRKTFVTEYGTKWLIGRSRNCSIFIPNTLVSRCHAVVGHCSEGGFYIMDVGSSNGTFVNRNRLVPQERRYIDDGDVLEISHTCVEFFVSGWHQERATELETQF